MHKPKLRIALLANSLCVPAWMWELVSQIQDGDYADVVLVVVNDSKRAKRSFASRFVGNINNLCYFVLNWLDKRLGKNYPDPFSKKDLGELLDGTPVIKVQPEQTRYSDKLSSADVALLKEHDLDVCIRLGFRILRGGVLDVARYGVWSFHHGDNNINRGMPAGVWETLEMWPVTGSILQVLSEDLDGGTVLYRSWSATDKVFFNRNKGRVCWKSLSFVARRLKQLHRMGGPAFLEMVDSINLSPPFYSRRLYTIPTNVQVLVRAAKHYSNVLANLIRRIFFYEQWLLYFRISKSSDISTVLWRFKPIQPPRDVFWADPFVVSVADKYFIFFEEFSYADKKGHISCLEIGADGAIGNPCKVLSESWHLSYPFIFEYEGNYFMVPEMSRSNRIGVYRAKNFPDQWEYHSTLIEDVRASDTTLYQEGGRWWLFTSIRERPGSNTMDELFLYMSDCPFGPWSPHPMNPVVSDVRSARCAGRLFKYRGKLYRPSQDCSSRYGSRMVINEVLTLDQETYCEVAVNHIEPMWQQGLLATHTINSDKELTIVDGLKNVPRYWR